MRFETHEKDIKKDIACSITRCMNAALGSVTRGVFIITSSFSKPAIEFANGYPHATISLIDGKKLTELMIEYNLGVSEERTICLKKLDSDYLDL